MKIIILGGPGSGKGTQGQFLSKRYNIPAISAGDLLRAVTKQQTPLGLKIKETIDNGDLVSSELMVSMIIDRINKDDCENGFLLDGFPRNASQADAFDEVAIAIDYVLHLDVPDDVIVERLSGRRIHPASGRTYHVLFNPPKIPGLDDVTGEPLLQRDDDREEIIRKRLFVYHEQTEPLVEHYRSLSEENVSDSPKYKSFDALQGIDEARDAIFSFIDNSQEL